MLKMHQLFLGVYIVIYLFAFIIISFTIYFWSKNIYMDEIKKNLSQSIHMVSFVLNNSNNIKKSIKELEKQTNSKITLITKNQHPMVKEEIEYKISFNKVFYASKTIKINGKTYIIKVVNKIDKIHKKIFKLFSYIVAIIIIFLIIIFLITFFIKNKIKNETNLILTYLKNLNDNKKIDYKINSIYIQEFYKITQALNKVAQKVIKKSKQKTKQAAKLKLSNRQKDDMISAISHEFKNPIAIISGYSQTLLLNDNLPNTLREKFLNKINSNANKVSLMIDRLRLSLKLEEEKQQIIFTKCSIKKLCNKIILDLKDNYKDRKIVLKGEDIILKIDETLMEIALRNLLENALKYSESDVVINLSNKTISIIDKGIGLEQKELNKIDKKFYRVSNNGWNNSLGLGLFIVYRIILLHGFTLEIKSKIHKGSEFIVKY